MKVVEGGQNYFLKNEETIKLSHQDGWDSGARIEAVLDDGVEKGKGVLLHLLLLLVLLVVLIGFLLCVIFDQDGLESILVLSKDHVRFLKFKVLNGEIHFVLKKKVDLLLGVKYFIDLLLVLV